MVQLSEKQHELLKLLANGYKLEIPVWACISKIEGPDGKVDKELYRRFSQTSINKFFNGTLIQQMKRDYYWFEISTFGRAYLENNPEYIQPVPGKRKLVLSELDEINNRLNCIGLDQKIVQEFAVRLRYIRELVINL